MGLGWAVFAPVAFSNIPFTGWRDPVFWIEGDVRKCRLLTLLETTTRDFGMQVCAIWHWCAELVYGAIGYGFAV